MTSPPRNPGLSGRLSAAAALLLGVVAGGLEIAQVVRHPYRLVLLPVLVVVVPIALWFALTRGGWRRHVAAGVAVVALAIAVAVTVRSTSGWQLVLEASLLLLAFGVGRHALGMGARTLKSLGKGSLQTEPARRPVLIVNQRSGGGKARRFHLDEQCRRRGIEPITLREGDDIEKLAERVIDAGADVIGVAGGDGSMAPVAAVAAARDVAFVVVPAGTFNHFARDLGLDLDDVVGALDAFGESVERRVDLGELNGRPFVNNVSLGLYASIARMPEYRDAKIDTALRELPRLLGPGSHPFDLRFVGPEGERWAEAHVVQVSNGPYGKDPLSLDTRPHLDTGGLGIIALKIPDRPAEGRLLDALASGRPDRYEGFRAWRAPAFEVTSGSPVAAGRDGESVEIEPPLRFASRPRVLRVRLPRHAIGDSPAARNERRARAIPDLWRIVVGRRVSGAARGQAGRCSEG